MIASVVDGWLNVSSFPIRLTRRPPTLLLLLLLMLMPENTSDVTLYIAIQRRIVQCKIFIRETQITPREFWKGGLRWAYITAVNIGEDARIPVDHAF